MAELFMLTNLINFACLYSNYWMGLVCTGLSTIVMLLSRGLIYGDDWSFEMFTITIFMIALQFIAITFIYLFITRLGLMHVDQKVNLQSKDALLANLKGRVIVMDIEEKTVLFQNHNVDAKENETEES